MAFKKLLLFFFVLSICSFGHAELKRIINTETGITDYYNEPDTLASLSAGTTLFIQNSTSPVLSNQGFNVSTGVITKMLIWPDGTVQVSSPPAIPTLLSTTTVSQTTMTYTASIYVLNNQLLVGTTSPRLVGPSSVNATFQIEGISGTTSHGSIVYNSNDVAGPILVFGKSRGASIGSIGATQSGDRTGEIRWAASDGTNLAGLTALIRSNVDGVVATGVTPGKLEFFTTPSGANSPSSRLLIDSTGTVTVSGTLIVAGTFQYPSKTKAAILAITPSVGQGWYCSDCTTSVVCVATGTTVGSVANISGRTTACQ